MVYKYIKNDFRFHNFRYYSLISLFLLSLLFADTPKINTRLDAIKVQCESIINSDLSALQKSYAQLRIAKIYQLQNKNDKAIIEYEKIKANAQYPDIHRYEASETIKEIKRVLNGLPARDPNALHQKITVVNPAIEYFVAVDGSDANPGSREKPFKSMEKARDAVRSLKAKKVPPGGVAITIKPGEYSVVNTLLLTEKDSGTVESPIIYRAEKSGTVTFYGGDKLTGFKMVDDKKMLSRLPEESRGKIYQCDLKALGIADYGALKVRGFGQPPSPPTLELYFNGTPMTLARWPNKGFVKPLKLINPGEKGGNPSVIQYDSPRHERWVNADDLWLFGYFKYLWADSTIKVSKIDTVAKTLTTDQSYNYGGAGMSEKEGIIYYAFNIPEEIDTPGEWYLDRANGILYFWPPSDPTTATIEIGQLSEPMISMNKVSDVRIEGITFDLARYNGITIKDCENCLVAGVTVKRFAGDGIIINGGKKCGILSSDLYTMGRRATEVIGGNRETLTPGEHFVENCRFYDFGRIDRTYTPAIRMEGVGNHIAFNELYNCPSSVIKVMGNDHIVEYNYIHNAVQESDDQACMDTSSNPTFRGTIFRYNKFFNNMKTGSEQTVNGQGAIRFDECISGMQVYSNIFYRSSNGLFGAVHINTGRDNLIDNNIFVECNKGITGKWYPKYIKWQQVAHNTAPQDFYATPLYLSRYPAIATMTDNNGINSALRNIFYKCGPAIGKNFEISGNVEFGLDPGFVDVNNNDFTLKPDAAIINAIGFKPIPVADIGLYKDKYR